MDTWTVKKILDWGIDFFKKKDIPQARLSAELLLAAVLDLSRMGLYLDHGRVLKPRELATYKNHILRRLEHVPIQYILGEAHFRDISLYVDENVLIPRPETELLVEKALQEASGIFSKKGCINILEIGTGSGAVAISLYREIIKNMPGDRSGVKVTATDISDRAIDIAVKNARRVLGGEAAGGPEFICCDIFPGQDSSWLPDNKGRIDMVVSNPPYISESGFQDLPREIREYEPRDALVAGKTGLESYKRILERIKELLQPGPACMILETDPQVGERLLSLVGEYMDIKSISLDKDYNQRDRILTVHT